jgi:hypothetical protein
MTTVHDFSAAERRLRDGFRTGQMVDFESHSDEEDDPAVGDAWGADREIRASVVAALLCGAVPVEQGHVARVYLRGARISGMIVLAEGEVKHALWLDRCHVARGIDLSNATTRTVKLTRCLLGPVKLSGASIGGELSFSGSELTGEGGIALDAQELTVARSMACDEIRAVGEVCLMGAKIGGRLSLRGAHLAATDRPALNAEALTVGGDLLCDGKQFMPEYPFGVRPKTAEARGHFRVDGLVNLHGAKVGADLSFQGAELLSVGGKDGEALFANDLTVTGLVQSNFFVEGLTYLHGFTYGDLQPYQPARRSLDWLRQSPGYGYRDQPYQQLAAYYRLLGQDDQARYVLLRRQRARTREQPWWVRPWGWLQDGLTGYGYAPGRAFALLVLGFIGGWLVFRAHHPAPTSSHDQPTFNAALYTLDLLIPAPGLGNVSDWNPHGGLLVVAAALRGLGWLLAITVIAAITRSLSRN